MDVQPEVSDGGDGRVALRPEEIVTKRVCLLGVGGTPGWPKNATAQSETHKECVKKIPGGTCGFSAGRKRRWRKWLRK